MPSEQRPIRLRRNLLLCAGAAYLVWWGFVRLSLPDAFNPLPGRALVVACFFALVAASHAWPAVARQLDAGLTACCGLATAHYFYLFAHNQADLNWIVGSYITVIAVCAILQTARSLLVYSILVAILSAALLLREPVSYVVFLPGMLTILLFANVGLRTRLRLLEQQRQAEAALSVVNRELESFSYSVAHDLRSPLRAINGYSHTLLEDYGARLDEEGKRQLERIASAARTMGELIDALLGLARVTRHEARRVAVDLSQEAEAVARQLRSGQPGRTVDFVGQPGVVAQGDPVLLRALLDNLIGNAWKFTGRSPSARVAFGCTTRDGAPVYFVQDNGAGFDMAFAKRLFAPFARLHDAADYPGTGIGLATVRRIVDRHGGKVWAEAQVDRGATFYFTLQAAGAGAES